MTDTFQMPTFKEISKEQYEDTAQSTQGGIGMGMPSEESMQKAYFGQSVTTVRIALRNGHTILDALARRRTEIMSGLTDDELSNLDRQSDIWKRLSVNILAEELVREKMRAVAKKYREVGIATGGGSLYDIAALRYEGEDWSEVEL